jgi:thiol:disulfide interchange protein DsbD
MKGMLATILALAWAWAPAAPAQTATGAAPPRAETLVQAAAAPVRLAAVGRGEALVTITIAAGWHVNANPASPAYMIPTTVSVAGAAGIVPGRVVYPPGKRLQVAFDPEPLSAYSGTVEVRVPLSAAPGAAAGSVTLAGRVQFQSCNDQVCLAPVSVPFNLVVMVAGVPPGPGAAPVPGGQGAPSWSSTKPFPPAPPVPAGRFTPASSSSALPAAGGSWVVRWVERALARGGPWWLIGLFVGGLALNLTPCVFPMLGVTVSVFGARRKERPAKVLMHAVAYVVGIMITYSVLGVIAALTGGLFGAALQNPWVNVGLGALFVVLSLSMFGLYEMQPPTWLLQRLGGADATSLLGIFLSGLAVGIIAAPCVGPIVVGVLALIARRAEVLFGFRTMLVLSLGLGFPYLFLALFSNLLQSLPRSGDWMLWVKKLFGVLLVSIGLFYLLVGLAPRLTDWVLPAALVVGGLYLGFVDRHGLAKGGFRRFRWAVGTLAVAGGVLAGVLLEREGIRFEPYDEALVSAALASGQPVMLDFSADWCLPCHELEHGAFADRSVIARSRDFAAFKVDLTSYDSPWAKGLRERFGVTGVPEVLFFTPDGGEVREARVIGPLPAGPLLERMAAVARMGRASAG